MFYEKDYNSQSPTGCPGKRGATLGKSLSRLAPSGSVESLLSSPPAHWALLCWVNCWGKEGMHPATELEKGGHAGGTLRTAA